MKKRDKKNSRFITVLFSRLPCGTRRRKSLENKTVINLEFFLSLFFILLFPQTLKRSNIITGFLLPFFFFLLKFVHSCILHPPPDFSVAPFILSKNPCSIILSYL